MKKLDYDGAMEQYDNCKANDCNKYNYNTIEGNELNSDNIEYNKDNIIKKSKTDNIKNKIKNFELFNYSGKELIAVFIILMFIFSTYPVEAVRVIASHSFCSDDASYTSYDQRNTTLCSLEETSDSSNDILSINMSSSNFSLSNSSWYNWTVTINASNGTNNKLWCKTPFASRGSGNCRINVERQSGNPSQMAFKVDTGGFSKTCNFDAFAKATAYIQVDRPGAKIQVCTDQCSGCSNWETITVDSGDYVAVDTTTLGRLNGNVQPFRVFNSTIIDINGTDDGGPSPDTTNPTIKSSINKSLNDIFQNDIINSSFNVTDETALSFGQIIINQTGTKEFFNYSLSGASAEFSNKFTISCASGCVVNITGLVNDTSNNKKQNETIFTVTTQAPDTTPPSITNLINSTTTNQSVSITWSTNESSNETNTLGLCPLFTGILSNSNSTLSLSHIQSINSLSNSTNYCYNTTACDSSNNCASSNFSFYTASNPPQGGGGGGGAGNGSSVIKSWSFCSDDQGFTGYSQRNLSLCSLEDTTDFSDDIVSANASSSMSLSNMTNYNVSFKVQCNNCTNTKLYCKTPGSAASGTCRYNLERQGTNETAVKIDTGGFSKTCHFSPFNNVTVNIEVNMLANSTRACVNLCSGCTSWQSISIPSGDFVSVDTGTLGRLNGNVLPIRVFNVTVYNLNATSNPPAGGGGSSATSSNEQNLVYDGNGNLVSGDGYYREYNELNQLIRIRSGNLSTSPTLEEFVWHPIQEKILIKDIFKNGVKDTSVYYVSDEFIRIENSSGNYTEKYVYQDGVLVAQVNTNGQKQFVHNDHLGSVTLTTDASGNVQEQSFFEPFGNVIEGGEGSRYDYNGKEQDKLTGELDYGARMYKPGWGKFVAPDTLTQYVYEPQFFNHYTYTKNNPYKFIDPNGHVVVYFYGHGATSSGGSSDLEKLQARETSYQTSVVASYNQRYAVSEFIKSELQRDKNQPVIIVGHSLGGNSAIKLSNSLKESHIEVDLVVTIDQVGPNYAKPDNVKQLINIRQVGGFDLHGNKIEGADEEYVLSKIKHTDIDNIDKNPLLGMIPKKADELYKNSQSSGSSGGGGSGGSWFQCSQSCTSSCNVNGKCTTKCKTTCK